MASSESTASESTASKKQTQRRGKKVQSSHVAPRGQRERVAQPRTRDAAPAPQSPPRRRLERGRKAAKPATESMTQPRSDYLSTVISSRMLSAVILFCLVVVLVLFFQADSFYVSHIEVGGLSHMTAEEIFALSEVANMHIFWLDANEIEASIRRSSSIGAVDVAIGWPPHQVQIEVQEREPVVIWEQAGYRTWIDAQGRVMPLREDMNGLVRIVADGAVDALTGEDRIPPQIIDGALQLKALYSNIEVLVYNPIEGLGYQDGRGWRVWFGDGSEMATKLLVYDTIVRDLQARGIQPEYIDVGSPHAPYYKIWWVDQPEDENLPEQAAPAGEDAAQSDNEALQ